MLNKDNIRELAYVVTIDSVQPIDGYDRVELAHVGGWTVVVGKGEFEQGSAAIYFEIDSKLPEVKPFIDMEFLAKKKYKVKTQKMCNSYSQGLLIHPSSFGWAVQVEPLGGVRTEVVIDDEGNAHYPDDESRFLTQKLNITYAVVEDNKRKAKSADKYMKMAQRHRKLFAKQPYRWLMQREWGRKFLFVFYGKKKDTRNWPAWVSKTDEERVQNMPWVLTDKSPLVVTEKIDGSSTTFTIYRGKGLKKDQFYVCSRNVVFDTPEKAEQCFYDSNIYLEMAEKYDIENKMKKMLEDNPQYEWITIQGETYGAGVQKRDYSIQEHRFMAFNLVTSVDGRWGTVEMSNFLGTYDIPCVPIIDTYFILPDTVEELLECASGESVLDDKPREGFVFRSADGQLSFKAVSNEYLMKYH